MSKYNIKESELMELINESVLNTLNNEAKSFTRNFASGFNAGKEFSSHPLQYMKRKGQEIINNWAYNGNVSSSDLNKAIQEFIQFGGEQAKFDVTCYACSVLANYSLGTSFTCQNVNQNANWEYMAKYSSLKERFIEFSQRFLNPQSYNQNRNRNYDYKNKLKLKRSYAQILQKYNIDINGMIQQSEQYRQQRQNKY